MCWGVLARVRPTGSEGAPGAHSWRAAEQGGCERGRDRAEPGWFQQDRGSLAGQRGAPLGGTSVTKLLLTRSPGRLPPPGRPGDQRQPWHKQTPSALKLTHPPSPTMALCPTGRSLALSRGRERSPLAGPRPGKGTPPPLHCRQHLSGRGARERGRQLLTRNWVNGTTFQHPWAPCSSRSVAPASPERRGR